MSSTKGKAGEDIAARFLRKKGYKVLERNFRGKRGEIDIIALDPGGVLCFVEVKTRNSEAFGRPEEAVTPSKIYRIKRTAEEYMKGKKYCGDVRVEVVSIMEGSVEHIIYNG